MAGPSSGIGKGPGKTSPYEQARLSGNAEKAKANRGATAEARKKAAASMAKAFGGEYGRTGVERRTATAQEKLELIAKTSTEPAGTKVEKSPNGGAPKSINALAQQSAEQRHRLAQAGRSEAVGFAPKTHMRPLDGLWVGKEMSPKYRGEETGAVWGSKVKYLDGAERAAYQLKVVDGLLVDASGKRFDTTNASSAHTGAGSAIFVMAPDGTLYGALSHNVGRFHHSSFLAGGPVAGAGELVVKEGVLQTLSDRSGHYSPDAPYTAQALDRLQRMGVDLSNVTVESWNHGRTSAKAFVERYRVASVEER